MASGHLEIHRLTFGGWSLGSGSPCAYRDDVLRERHPPHPGMLLSRPGTQKIDIYPRQHLRGGWKKVMLLEHTFLRSCE